jgi:hypothetical protein
MATPAMSPHDEMNVYQSAEARFEVAAKKLGLEQGVYRFMRFPNKEITVYIPVMLDSGQLEVFIGYRVHHCRQGAGGGYGGARTANAGRFFNQRRRRPLSGRPQRGRRAVVGGHSASAQRGRRD